MYNLPLKCRTKETVWAIGSKLGSVMEVDVSDSGVQWGKYLRARVKLDITKKTGAWEEDHNRGRGEQMDTVQI